MNAQVIKSEDDYQASLAHIETLMDAAPGSPELEELELFTILVENYEEEHFPIDLPDPVDAIKFRMEQQGLTRHDLVQYIGSQSKVSEVLNRKRPLSLSMIRSLHTGLGIPAEVLLKESGKKLENRLFDYRNYPFIYMFKRGYFKSFKGTLQQAKDVSEELLEQFFAGLQALPMQRIYCRNTATSQVPNQTRGGVAHSIAEPQDYYISAPDESQNPNEVVGNSVRSIDENALVAWLAGVLNLAQDQELPPFSDEQITIKFLSDVVKLSYFSAGPKLAEEFLNKNGIHLIISPHLPRTYLDGACFKTSSGRPVIGLTLRHDRLDNFWFTLAHELAHIYLHLKTSNLAFFDDTEHEVQSSINPCEIETNALTADLLIPNELWEQGKEEMLHTHQEIKVKEFANRLKISPAIVAGRIRWETNDFTLYSSLIGRKSVKRLLLA